MDHCWRKFIGNLALTEITPCYPSEAMPPILILIRRTLVGFEPTPGPPLYGRDTTSPLRQQYSSNEYVINNFKELILLILLLKMLQHPRKDMKHRTPHYTT